MKKRLLFLVVSALLWSGTATAQPAKANTDEGYCDLGLRGDVTWKYERVGGKGVLTISGKGKMAWYVKDDGHCNPWRSKRIASVKIDDGVTSIGNYAFWRCLTEEISIPNSVTSIGNGAFYECVRLPNITIPESVTAIAPFTFWGVHELDVDNAKQ